MDVHSYAYLARKAFAGFIPRLATVIFENAFIIQGNTPEELPEMLLACARVSRVDFNKVCHFVGMSAGGCTLLYMHAAIEDCIYLIELAVQADDCLRLTRHGGACSQ